jgi:hypothetical protein
MILALEGTLPEPVDDPVVYSVSVFDTLLIVNNEYLHHSKQHTKAVLDGDAGGRAADGTGGIPRTLI